MAPVPIAGADALVFGHGDDAESPIPVPRARSINERAAATNALAITAAHDTPYALESFVITDWSI